MNAIVSCFPSLVDLIENSNKQWVSSYVSPLGVNVSSCFCSFNHTKVEASQSDPPHWDVRCFSFPSKVSRTDQMSEGWFEMRNDRQVLNLLVKLERCENTSEYLAER